MTNIDLISGAGVLLILAAFILSTLERLSTASRMYFTLNLFGGLLAATGAWLADLIPFVVMEVVWTLVAAGGLWKTFQSR